MVTCRIYTLQAELAELVIVTELGKKDVSSSLGRA